MASRTNSSGIVNQSLVDDVKRMNGIRYENERLKKEIELLKYERRIVSRQFESSLLFRLKCNERLLYDEEVRMLRQQATRNNEYRTLIAKHEAELTVRDHSGFSDLLNRKKDNRFLVLVETARTTGNGK